MPAPQRHPDFDASEGRWRGYDDEGHTIGWYDDEDTAWKAMAYFGVEKVTS